TLADRPATFTPISAHPFIARPKPLVRFMWNWGGAVRATRQIIQQARARGPVVLVATGGFVAAPAAQAARVERVPILLVNLDAVPGKANVWISKRATRIVTAAPAEGFAWEAVPPIVRAQAVGALSPEGARTKLGLDPAKTVLLVTGGSQGASSMNQLMLAMLAQHQDAFAGWQVLHQTGKDAPESALREAYAAAGVPAIVTPFVDGLGVWWNAATLALARSGAGNVAEVWANRVPAIFMPYPYHKDQHQKINAKTLVAAGGAVVHTDHIDAATNVKDAGAAMAILLRDQAKIGAMRASLDKLGPADGAERVARMAIEMLRTG
ncbi:MAG TPA: glycosyltransferase, partial [Phycisphaerales bacterium]|nr:glycosyltransferase [Phycisphaerales bacterium]